MEIQVAYRFESGQTADRFLNRLKAGAVANVKARRHSGGYCILVRYDLAPDTTFNATCQQLDDLAESLEGYEVSL